MRGDLMGKKTLLFGGAFDPPHKSHMCLAYTVLEHKEFRDDTELWFLPCYSDAFGQKNLTPPEHRVAMLNIVANFIGNNVSVCTTEIEMANSAGTYAIVMELRRRHPDRDFYYVIGSDQAGRIREWRNSRDLLKTIPFVVIRSPLRFGSYDWCFSPPHIWIDKPTKMLTMQEGASYRSSDIREFIRYKRNVHYPGLLFDTYSYISKHNLYI